MTAATSWGLHIQVTDHGEWNPDDMTSAASLVAVIHQHQAHDDPRPRVELWGDERTLVATIDGEQITVAPGEHLLQVRFPRGEQWTGASTDGLNALRPRAKAGA